ncbi:glycosyltransferase family 87 protein [Acidobacteriota bacterium]
MKDLKKILFKPPIAILTMLILLSPLFFLKIKHEMIDIEVDLQAGQRFLAGEPLYRASDGHYQYKYLPAYAAWMAPLALLPSGMAKCAVFYIISTVLLINLYLSYRLVNNSGESRPWLVILTFLIMAKFYGHELTLGQVNAIMLLPLLLMVHSLVKKRDIPAGVWLGLAISVKPYAVIFFPYLLIKRKFRTVLSALGTLVVILLIPALRYGFSGNLELLASMGRTLTASTPVLYDTQDNVSLFGFIAKWTHTDNPLVLYGGAFVVAAVLYGLLLLFSLFRSKEEKKAIIIECAVLLIYIPIFSPLGWDYVFLNSTLGVMFLLSEFKGMSRGEKTFIIFNFVLIGATIYDLMGRDLYSQFMKLSVLTLNFILISLYLLYMRARLKTRKGVSSGN